jgi:hypothetical protein
MNVTKSISEWASRLDDILIDNRCVRLKENLRNLLHKKRTWKKPRRKSNITEIASIFFYTTGWILGLAGRLYVCVVSPPEALTPDVIEAPAPKNKAWGVALLIPTERTSASEPSRNSIAIRLESAIVTAVSLHGRHIEAHC